MRKILQILIPLALFAVSGYAQDYKETFEDGNSLYADGNYKGAISKYESIIDAGYESYTLYYNLGNAYYKEKKYGKAILNYRRALLRSPHNSMVHNNLEMAQMRCKDKIDEIPTFFVKQWGYKIRSLVNVNLWSLFSLLGLLLSGIGFLAYRFMRAIRTRKIMFFSSIFFIVFALFSAHNAAVVTSKMTKPNYAIIMNPAVVVKGSPTHNGSDLFVLHEGTMVKFTDTQPIAGWREIRLSDGNVGWVENNVYEVI